MITIHTSSRRHGRSYEMMKTLAEALLKGDTVIIATNDVAKRDSIILALLTHFRVEVTCDAVMSHTPMHIVYDAEDPSPEPAMVRIEYGHEVRFGYKLKLKLKPNDPAESY